jgi:two-component system sensor histidine kinase KdpD
MNDTRPDPDSLLERVKAEEARKDRGSLKLFFGYAAGVGKTFAMLEAAHQASAMGREVVIGYVEPHARPETLALLDGLEALPPREVEFRGVALREFDPDAVLARRPELVLVDELAHTNAEGSRHAKRWQDVDDLLAAGIDVWSTLNVQHIDSLNDVVGRITGVTVRETVPDHVFDEAQDLELVDITPDELIGRLRAGKVYVPDQAQRAMDGFFRKSNLLALREFALRQAAQRVQADVETARRRASAIEPWPTVDRLMVCVGPSPSTARVVRTARRMAAALNAPWLAVAVEPLEMALRERARGRVEDHLRLAERLGAEAVTLPGDDIAATLLDYAHSRNVTKVLVGKTALPRWRRLLAGSVVDDLLQQSGDIDVYVVRGEDSHPSGTAMRRPGPFDAPGPVVRFGAELSATLDRTGDTAVYLPDGGEGPSSRPPKPSTAPALAHMVRAGLILVVGTLVATAFDRVGLDEANVVMAFLAAVALIAARYGRGPSVVSSIVAVLIFDFCFVPPRFTFAVADTVYIVTFGVMLAIALLISSLTTRLKAQVENGRLRERRTSALYELGKQLSSMSGATFLAAATARTVAEQTGARVVVYEDRPAGQPEALFNGGPEITDHPVSAPTAQWVIEHDRVAGAGTDTLPNAVALFLPLTASQLTVGALAVKADPIDRLLAPDQRRLLEACASQLALAIERDRMSIAASEARVQAQTEQVRSALLSGVSHDLRTPLAAIAGASTGLLQTDTIDETTRRQLLETIADEANRLTRLLENILQMSRLELGGADARMQWNILEEVVGSALMRTRRELGERRVDVSIPPDLPLLFVDGLLLEQLFVNLLENAARYTPTHAAVGIRARPEGRWLSVSIADDGPGLPAGSEERIFEKFYRGNPTADAGRGSGLGLAICRAVAKVHGGTIAARNRPEGGVEFLLRLPLPEDPPQVEPETD